VVVEGTCWTTGATVVVVEVEVELVVVEVEVVVVEVVVVGAKVVDGARVSGTGTK
jgi:hypothetical protein